MSLITNAIVDGKLDVGAFVRVIECKTKLGLSAIVVEQHERGLKLTMRAPSESNTFGGLGQLQDRYVLIKQLGFKVRWLVSPDAVKFDAKRHDVRALDLPSDTKRACLAGRQGCGNCDCTYTVGISEGSRLACFLVTL